MRPNLINPLSTFAHMYAPQVTHDMLSRVLRVLNTANPHLPGGAAAAVESLVSTWNAGGSHDSPFRIELRDMQSMYTQQQLMVKLQSNGSGSSQPAGSNKQTDNKTKSNDKNKSSGSSAASAASTNTKAPNDNKTGSVDLSPLDGFCFSACLGTACRKPAGQCTFKHADEFNKLPDAKQQSLKVIGQQLLKQLSRSNKN
jgi:hypothetical protein